MSCGTNKRAVAVTACIYHSYRLLAVTLDLHVDLQWQLEDVHECPDDACDLRREAGDQVTTRKIYRRRNQPAVEALELDFVVDAHADEHGSSGQKEPSQHITTAVLASDRGATIDSASRV